MDDLHGQMLCPQKSDAVGFVIISWTNRDLLLYMYGTEYVALFSLFLTEIWELDLSKNC